MPIAKTADPSCATPRGFKLALPGMRGGQHRNTRVADRLLRDGIVHIDPPALSFAQRRLSEPAQDRTSASEGSD
ncbi:hypothetical protein C7I55_20235 [Sphingomonas deserti]|uniref:Uncharacterized protein n=1 Tax=Allosphingosinicella deserti TaxID=2116704 RepID=A0A2P7QJ94_9SPHN|nr:hypothetical protein C7I55_20235 [Sphingomonas deserti]